MGRPLHLLIAEDSEDDAEFAIRELKRGGFDLTYERVETREAMIEALDRGPWDLVLSDYSMPTFDGLGVLEVVRERKIDIPVIIASGTITEEAAVAALRGGACDFITKGKLARLVPAVERELREMEGRKLRREAERALRVSEMRFRRLAESGVIGIVVEETTGEVVEANDTFLRFVGYSRRELEEGAIDWEAMTPPEWLPANALAIEQLRATGVAQPWEKEYVRKDGSRVSVLVAVAALEGSQRLGISLDLTARRRLEEQVRRSQKMEAIGTLAGGVAHDFNNLLSVILGYSSFLLETMTQGDPSRVDVDEIRKAGERAAELTRQLLAFSRQQVVQPRVLDLNQSIVGMDRMLRRLLGADIEFSILTAQSIGKIVADPSQIEQVIMNLVVNARDAMPKGGKLAIETDNVRLDEEYAAQHLDSSQGTT